MGMMVVVRASHGSGNRHDLDEIFVAMFLVDPNRGVAIVVGEDVNHVWHVVLVVTVGLDEREAKHASELVG